MILHRIGILRALFFDRSSATAAAARWQRASARDPDLVADVIRMGGILDLQPDDYQAGVPMGAPIDPCRLAYERGRRDLAVQICALMALTNDEMRSLMEDDR